MCNCMGSGGWVVVSGTNEGVTTEMTDPIDVHGTTLSARYLMNLRRLSLFTIVSLTTATTMTETNWLMDTQLLDDQNSRLGQTLIGFASCVLVR